VEWGREMEQSGGREFGGAERDAAGIEEW